MQNFWTKLKKPFFVLAPMADVTDAAFRRLIAKYGKPDVTWTEFVSADGLARAPEEGKKKLLKDLEYSESERPIVAQLFSSNSENMEKAAKLCADLGFDGIDINMGCPDKTVEKQGCGAAMIKNPERAREVIMAAKRGAPNLPISVKTRLGYNKDELETWLPFLLSCDLAAITIHARTRKEMSKVPARWDRIKRAVEIRDEYFSKNPEGSLLGKTLIIGNGDALDLEDAKQKAEESGADGVMLGRAIFGNPFLFFALNNSPHPDPLLHKEREVGIQMRLEVMLEHTKLFEELLMPPKNFAIMKKHYKAYVKDFDGAGDLRTKLMNAENAAEVENIVKDFLDLTLGTGVI
ncbi:MAG: tRNA-dihydrouridine synthase [Patescibacteria group bacterium]